MVGELIARRRRALGLSQVELGRRTGTSQRQVSRLENGEEGALPRRDTLDKFGAVLGITLAEFYQAAGLLPPAEEVAAPPTPARVPALEDVIRVLEADEEVMAQLADLKLTHPAVYERAIRALAEQWRDSARVQLALLRDLAAARPRES